MWLWEAKNIQPMTVAEINSNMFIITINVNGLNFLVVGFFKKNPSTLITRDALKA